MTTVHSGSINWSKSLTLQMKTNPTSREVTYEKTTATGKTVSGSVKTAASADGGVTISATRTSRLGTTTSTETAYTAAQVDTFKAALRDKIKEKSDLGTLPVQQPIKAAPIDEAFNPGGGFTVYFDEETGQVVCGMPPRLPDGTVLPFGGGTKTASAIIDTGLPQCPAPETI